jgi:hypothetical protein
LCLHYAGENRRNLPVAALAAAGGYDAQRLAYFILPFVK